MQKEHHHSKQKEATLAKNKAEQDMKFKDPDFPASSTSLYWAAFPPKTQALMSIIQKVTSWEHANIISEGSLWG